MTEAPFTLEGDTLTIHLGPVTLRGGRPVVNGTPAEKWSVKIASQKEDGLTLSITLPEWDEARFGVSLSAGLYQVKDPVGTPVQIRYWIAALHPDFELDSFGLRFEAVENMRAYLRNGYNSWDGSSYQEPGAMLDLEADRPETGYAMTQILPADGPGSVVIGFNRHDRFQQTFSFDTRKRPPSLTILTLWDRKDRTGQMRFESEQMVAYAHTSVERALRLWADIVSKASPRAPRLFGSNLLKQMSITGWCSWYNLYAYINEENILEHLKAAETVAKRENLPMRVFQIDDGFTPEMGDWLEVKPQFPRGMKALMDDIRAAGFMPGLWIGPFMVGCRSHLFRDHPDWVIRERSSGQPIARMKMYGEWRWHKRSEEYYVLDATHPEAFEYLRKVFHTWRHEWGCEYFKTDFMLFGADYGPDRADWHTPGMTRMEIFVKVMEMIRGEIGPEAIWLGCGCPLWPSVGLVDGVRIGGDVGVSWSGDLSAQSLLRDQATRNFANRILWKIDPDCILLRERFHNLSDAEVRSLAIYAGMAGGVTMTSDHLGELGPERIRLWKLLLQTDLRDCNYPFLGQTSLRYITRRDANTGKLFLDAAADDPVVVQVRIGKNNNAIFILNTGEETIERTYSTADLGLNGKWYVYDWTAGQAWQGLHESIPVKVERHDGTLLFLRQEQIDEEPQQLP